MTTVTRYYVGPIDEIETMTLDGRAHVLSVGDALECTVADAAFFDLQPENWSADPPMGVAKHRSKKDAANEESEG